MKNLKNLGKTLTKAEQRGISAGYVGGYGCDSQIGPAGNACYRLAIIGNGEIVGGEPIAGVCTEDTIPNPFDPSLPSSTVYRCI